VDDADLGFGGSEELAVWKSGTRAFEILSITLPQTPPSPAILFEVCDEAFDEAWLIV
jgi:hypothetical protein